MTTNNSPNRMPSNAPKGPTLLLSMCLVALAANVGRPVTAAEPLQPNNYQAAMAKAVRAAAESVLDSVVTVEVIGAGESVGSEVRQDAPTSGVIVSADGYVLASSLTIRRPAASILVLLPDGSRHAAKLVARDHHRELALLKIDPDEPLQAIRLADSLDVQIGQTTVSVGRYGVSGAPMVSTGVLSAVARLDGIALQTDARVSPALYGGPLVDLYGRVLGILVPAVAEGGAEEETSWYDSGVAFAIPADVIARKLSALREGQDIHKGLIGIVPKTSDPYQDGTAIAAVRLRSPAEAAGLKAGDRVVSVAGVAVRRFQEIRQQLGAYDAGDTIELKVDRDGMTMPYSITLTDSIPPLQPQRLGVIAAVDEGGTEGAAANGEGKSEPTRVIVTAVLPNSPADGSLKVGDVVTAIGESPVPDIASFRRLMITAEPDLELRVAVERGDNASSLTIEPASVAGPAWTDYPSIWSGADPADWSVEPLKLPDAANLAAVVRPKPSEDEAAPRSLSGGLGCLVLLLNPGAAKPADVAEQWREAAAKAGVAVCVIASDADGRWQPKEVDVVARMTAAVLKQIPQIEPAAVAVAAPGAVAGSKAEAADAMALMVAVAEVRTYFGVAISAETRPPAMRLPENDATTALQVFLPLSESDELPSWGEALELRGYPITRGAEANETTVLNWVRCLQAI